MFMALTIRKERIVWICIALGLAILLLVLSNPLLNKAQQVWGTPLQGKSIALDPGHGGPDSGARSTSGVSEKNVNLKICHYLRDYLQSAGAHVIMTRETDKDLADAETKGLSRRKAEDLHRRLDLAEDRQMELFISIHLNAIPSPRWTGSQTFYNPSNESSKKLAVSIQNELRNNLGNTKREARPKSNVYLMRESKLTTALVECGFLSNPQEATLMATDAYQKKIATAIYYGVLHYYDQGLKAPTS